MTTAWAPWATKQQFSGTGGTFRAGSKAKGCLHTTEGTSWPGYAGGGEAPHLTARPDFKTKKLVWHQHTPFNVGARALLNPAGGVQTNNENVVQIELVGTCDPATHAKWVKAGYIHIFWPQAPTWALQDLAVKMRWLETNNKIARTSVPMWLAYPSSYGSNRGQRMRGRAWEAFSGWVGHQHVPENDHGDPGNLNITFLLGYDAPGKSRRVVRGAAAVVGAILLTVAGIVAAPSRSAPRPPIVAAQPAAKAPAKSPVKVPVKAQTKAVEKLVVARPVITHTLRQGSTGTDVKTVQRVLRLRVDGSFGPLTRAAVTRFQRAHRLTIDGVVGPQTAHALGLTYR